MFSRKFFWKNSIVSSPENSAETEKEQIKIRMTVAIDISRVDTKRSRYDRKETIPKNNRNDCIMKYFCVIDRLYI